MLASVRPIAIVELIVAGGFIVVLTLSMQNSRRLRRNHPQPQELKEASFSDRRKLARWTSGKSVDIDPNLARIHVHYLTSSLPLLRQSYRLYGLWGALTVSLLILADPVAHPVAILLIVFALIFIAWSYRYSRQLERFVTRSTDASRGEGC